MKFGTEFLSLINYWAGNSLPKKSFSSQSYYKEKAEKVNLKIIKSSSFIVACASIYNLEKKMKKTS